MRAYHGDNSIKAAILAQLAEHRASDELIRGVYWEHGKGCAVGCTIHSGEHAEYETRFGIPQMLAHLEDRIFEGLPNGQAKEWPERFMASIRSGADLSLVGWQFLHWLLTTSAVNPGIEHPLVCAAVRQCAEALVPLTKGEPAAWSATSAAASAAASAALSATSAAASAAASAALSARCAVESAAGSAAGSAAWSAATSAAASVATSAARTAASAALSAAWVRMSDKLIELLEAASPSTAQIGGVEMPVCNAPWFLASELAGQLAEDHPDGRSAVFFDQPKRRVFSLRARGDADVSELSTNEV